jgi:hypothetical protein
VTVEAWNDSPEEVHDDLIHNLRSLITASTLAHESSADGRVAGSGRPEASSDRAEHAPGLGVVKP